MRGALIWACLAGLLGAHPAGACAGEAPAACDVAQVMHSLEVAWSHYFHETPRDSASKEAFVSRIWAANCTCGPIPALLESEATYLMWVDERQAARALLDQLRDDEINNRAHFINRLRARYSRGMDPAAALPMLRRALGGNAPTLRDKAIQWIHDELAPLYAPVIQPRVETPVYQGFLEALQDPSSPELAEVTQGLSLWVRAAKATEPSTLRGILAESWVVRAPDARPERYQLLIAGLMERHQALRDDALAAREHIIQELSARLGADAPRRERYWLAAAHYAQGQALLSRDHPRALQELREAARWAPVLAGHNATIEVSDEAARTGGPVDIESAAASALAGAGALADALAIEVDIALRAASHLPAVRRLHALVHPTQPFEVFWMQTLDGRLPIAPAFDLPGIEGARLRLDALRDRWVLLDFWGTWCDSCIPQMARIQALHEELSAKTASLACVVTIAAHDEPRDVRAFVARHGYTFPALVADEDTVERFGVEEYPSKRLVTPTGRLMQLRDTEWEETFRTLALGQDAPPAATR